MSRDAFWHLHSILKDDIIFQSTGTKPQRAVEFQLAAFLCHAGSMGGIRCAGVTGISEGTVYLYIDRISKALRNRRNQFLCWPNTRRRQQLKEEMEGWGFPGCIGIADGTLFRLHDKPKHDGFSFFCRKKFYAVSSAASSH